MLIMEVKNMWKKIKPYVISLIISLSVGGLSAILTKDSMELYKNIRQPALAPPGVVFPIVWTILFILMGISSAIIYIHKQKNPQAASAGLRIYVIQLIVNFFWSIIFFNFRAYLFSFIWLLILIGLIISMIYQFKKISNLAAYLQIPYLIWVLFAGYLNIMIYFLNKPV